MLNTETVQMLAQYKAWADKVMFDGVAALPPGEAEKERKTLFKTIIGTLNHIYVVDLIWQAHLEGRDHGFKARNVLVYPELAALQAAQQTVNDWIIDWSKAQSETSANAAKATKDSWVCATSSARNDPRTTPATASGRRVEVPSASPTRNAAPNTTIPSVMRRG